jgi:hypothetical protein
MRGGGGLARTRVVVPGIHRPGPRTHSARVFIDSLVRRSGGSEGRNKTLLFHRTKAISNGRGVHTEPYRV